MALRENKEQMIQYQDFCENKLREAQKCGYAIEFIEPDNKFTTTVSSEEFKFLYENADKVRENENLKNFLQRDSVFDL